MYRSSHSVKHFKIQLVSGDLVLGNDRFTSLEMFLKHFETTIVLEEKEGTMYLYDCTIYRCVL